MAGSSGFPGIQQQQRKEEGVSYLCVTNVQITDRRMGKPLGQPITIQQASSEPKVHQMRMVGHVREKGLDILEGTTIITDEISIGIAGLFYFPIL